MGLICVMSMEGICMDALERICCLRNEGFAIVKLNLNSYDIGGTSATTLGGLEELGDVLCIDEVMCFQQFSMNLFTEHKNYSEKM